MPAPLPPLGIPAPAPYFHPLFLISLIPPPGEVLKIYSPPLKKRAGGGWGDYAGNRPNDVIEADMNAIENFVMKMHTKLSKLSLIDL